MFYKWPKYKLLGYTYTIRNKLTIMKVRVTKKEKKYNIGQGWPDFFSGGPNFIEILNFGPQKKILPYFFLHKYVN